MSRRTRRPLQTSILIGIGSGLCIWLFPLPITGGGANHLRRMRRPMVVSKALVLRCLESRGWPHENRLAGEGEAAASLPSRPAGPRPCQQANSWWSDGRGTTYPWEWPRLPMRDTFPVQPSLLARAERMLARRPIVKIGASGAERLIGRRVAPVRGTGLYLVRALSYEDHAQNFEVFYQRGRLWVNHLYPSWRLPSSGAHASPAVRRYALVVRLRSAPTRVFVTSFIEAIEF